MRSIEYNYLTLQISKNEKTQKISFLSQNDQKSPLRTAKMTKFSIKIFDFRCHLSTFKATNIPKSRFFRTENND